MKVHPKGAAVWENEQNLNTYLECPQARGQGHLQCGAELSWEEK